MSVVFGVLLLLSLLAARAVGQAVGRRLGVTPGAAGARMPRLPDEEGQSPGRRKLLKWLIDHPREVEVGPTAAALHLTPERVEAWLEGLALRLPCRVQITQRGRVRYDFPVEALQGELRRDRLLRLGRPFVWLGLVLVNLGASWPLIFSLAIVYLGLSDISSWEDEFLTVGVTILAAVGITIGGVLGVSALMGFVLGPLAEDEPEPVARIGDETPTPARTVGGVRQAAVVAPKRPGRSWNLGKIDDPRALLVIVVAVLIAAVVGSALVGLYAWAVGLWRSLSGRRLHAELLGPAVWARQQPRPDALSKLVPTNDMVGRALRALRTALRRPRPVDGELADRVAAMLRRGAGRLSAVDLALAEGFDPDDAVEVLTRICVRHDGRMAVSSAGDLVAFVPVFAAPRRPAGLQIIGPPPPFEAILGEDRGQVVSLPGLQANDLAAARRLAGGTLLLCLGAIWFFSAGSGWWLLALPGVVVVNLLVAGLAAATRHAIFAHQALARLRDARRHAGRRLLAALQTGQPLGLRELIEGVEEDLGLPANAERRNALRAELSAWLETLDFEEISLRAALDLAPLAARRRAADALPAPSQEGPDEVIFDSSRIDGQHAQGQLDAGGVG